MKFALIKLQDAFANFGVLALFLLSPISIIELLLLDLPFNQPVLLACNLKLHLIVPVIVAAMAIALSRSLQHNGVTLLRFIAECGFVALFSFVLACGALVTLNMLNFASLMPHEGTVLLIEEIPKRRFSEYWLQLKIVGQAEPLKLKLQQEEWNQFKEGDHYSRHLRSGLLGIPWRWTWE